MFSTAVAVVGEFTVSEAAFTQQLDFIAAQHLKTSSLHALEGVALTFDDGKQDALETVAPALQKRGLVRTEYTQPTLRETLREF